MNMSTLLIKLLFLFFRLLSHDVEDTACGRRRREISQWKDRGQIQDLTRRKRFKDKKFEILIILTKWWLKVINTQFSKECNT